jgi:sugar phosphate isomerase/epimerase
MRRKVLAVSSLAWRPEEEAAALALLVGRRVGGIELAPATVVPDWDWGPGVAEAYRNRLHDFGLAVPALQGIFFGIRGLALFGDRAGQDRLVAHCGRVAHLAMRLGAKTCVFGAPALRRPGRPFAEAKAEAVEVLARCAAAAWNEGAALAFEPNPEIYGCAFATTLAEAWEVVAAVDHPGLGIQWDGGQIQASGAADGPALAASAPRCLHAHASQPGLGPFAPPAPAHARLAAVLPDAASPWLSIEMTAAGLAALDEALARVREIYADVLF